MSESSYDDLVQRLRSGEYDGADIMAAWIALEEKATQQVPQNPDTVEITVKFRGLVSVRRVSFCEILQSRICLPSAAAQHCWRVIKQKLNEEDNQ